MTDIMLLPLVLTLLVGAGMGVLDGLLIALFRRGVR